MATLRSPRLHFLCALQVLFLLQSQTHVLSYQYKVGDLDAWGIPTDANPQVYAIWAKFHPLKIGDSLMFLYPPSQDSVIQVTAQSYDACNLTDPILYMNNGNSLFNITAFGNFYFTSGTPAHCEKKQKLHITVGNVSADSPSYGPSTAALPDTAPSYPTVFGSIPTASSSAHALSQSFSVLAAAAAVGFSMSAAVGRVI